jgi:ubiquinone/menaquinone biosynthesis C-methylase UbiE
VGDLGQHDDTQGTRPPSESLRTARTPSRLSLLCPRGGLFWDIEAEYAPGTPENAVTKCGVSRDQKRGAMMSTNFGAGFHVAPGRAVATSAYDRWVGRWSRLFGPTVLEAAEVKPDCRVLDISTGTGEAASMTLPVVGPSGFVIGADITPAMLEAARDRLHDALFWPVTADGQALPFRDSSFDAVICQPGLQFFTDPALGLKEFRRVLRMGGCAAACVISTPDRAPMWGILADALNRFIPEQRDIINLSFSLADPKRLEGLLAAAGFRDIRVEREKREDIVESFDDYWQPIEAATGSQPQIYLTLSELDRRSVREEVKARLSRFESDGKLLMSVEMLIGRGRA